MHCSRVDAFRHRAAAIIADPGTGSHVYRWLTLTLPVIARRSQNACRATNVMRHGLWPIFFGARVAENRAAASFASISASL